jgi:hypothetical protein
MSEKRPGSTAAPRSRILANVTAISRRALGSTSRWSGHSSPETMAPMATIGTAMPATLTPQERIAVISTSAARRPTPSSTPKSSEIGTA